MQAGHFQSRRFNITRFDEMNVHGQCYGCNVMRYGEQYKYAKHLDEVYGIGTAELLELKARGMKQFKPWELEELIDHYKMEIIKLQKY